MNNSSTGVLALNSEMQHKRMTLLTYEQSTLQLAASCNVNQASHRASDEEKQWRCSFVLKLSILAAMKPMVCGTSTVANLWL